MNKKLRINYISLLLSILFVFCMDSIYLLYSSSMTFSVKAVFGAIVLGLSLFIGINIGNIYKATKYQKQLDATNQGK